MQYLKLFMLQWFSITVPANTARTSPTETEIKIDSGRIIEWRVEIPKGHAGYTGFQVHDKNVAIFPRQRDNWVSGDDTKFSITDDYEVNKTSTRLVFKAFNEGDKFTHTFKLGINVIKKDEVNLNDLMLTELRKISNALGAR